MATPEPAADEDAPHAELTTFQCREAYVYKIPPASTIGHRAELWDVDHWLQEVSAAVVTCGDECWVRLFDKASSELFAECPIPLDRPLITVVEPVVDSSRYYVLRIVDRASQRHAFIGVGFRERGQASDFNAALDEHLQYLRRQKEAARMKAEYAAAASASGTDGGSSNGPARDLALKPGETIKVALPGSRVSDGTGTTPPTQRLSSLATKAQFSLFSSPTPVKLSGARSSPGSSSDGSPPGMLPPPPPPRQLMPQPSAKVPAVSEQDGTNSPPLLRASPMAVSPKHPRAEAASTAEQPDAASSGPHDFHTRSDLGAGGETAGGHGVRTGEGLGPRSMRVSINMDEDAASEAASLANLSLKAHTSGGSSLAGSITYSDGGHSSETGADDEAEAHRAAHASASDAEGGGATAAAIPATAGPATAEGSGGAGSGGVNTGPATAPGASDGAQASPSAAEAAEAGERTGSDTAGAVRTAEGQTVAGKDDWGDFIS